MLFSIDEASLTRKGDVVKFWERLVFPVPEQRDQTSGQMVKEKRIHRVMNCADHTQGHIYTALFAPDGRQIEVVYLSEANVEMKLIAPNSVAAKELEWVCVASRSVVNKP